MKQSYPEYWPQYFTATPPLWVFLITIPQAGTFPRERRRFVSRQAAQEQ